MDSSITVAVKPSGMNHVGDELSDFVNDASEVYGFDLQHVIAVGYSNLSSNTICT
jgi:predicted esterase